MRARMWTGRRIEIGGACRGSLPQATPQRAGCAQKARVLAGAIIVKRGGLPARAHQRLAEARWIGGMRAACERGRIQAGTREHAFDPAPYAYPVGIRARNLLRDGFNLVMGAAPFARATDRKLDRRSRRLCHPTDTLAKRSRTLRHAFVADDIRPGSCAKPRSQAHPRLESETPPPPQQADGGAGFAASRIRHGQFRFFCFIQPRDRREGVGLISCCPPEFG